jgi:hypothetical protein
VTQFLTTFQKFFRGNDVERKGPISVSSFEQAVRYRQRLREHYDLENKLIILRKDGSLPEDQLKEWQAAVESSQDIIESISASEKALHELLRRFEVWSTQALAKDALMYCIPRSASSTSHGDHKAPELICCSTLFNLPGAAHFLTIMPGNEPRAESDGRDHVHGLGLPPNAWTWPQYVRICNMVSLLRDPMEASRSPLTAASPSLIGQRKEELKLSYDARLTPADLVALWTRAQRNTSALLHLLHLFEVSDAPDELKERTEHYSIRADSGHRGKVLVPQVEEESEPEPRYVAKFVGNHKKTRKFVLSISKLLDELVEWAVTNQTLYTHRYIREGIQQQKSATKRPCPDDANLDVPTKKSKLIPQRPDDATDDVIEIGTESVRARRRIIVPNGKEKELLHACQCYVLRWFARRNRKVASIIFTSKFDHVCLFPYETLVQKLVEEKLPSKVKRRLKGDCQSNDRTLARIDRRVRIGKFDEGYDPNFQQVVVSLLNALASCTPADVLAESDVRAACADFVMFHETFLSRKSAAEAAELLLGADFDTDENPIDLLLSFTAPWDVHCSACDGGLGNDNVFRCANCDKVFHEKCAGDGDKRSLIDLVQSYDPLAQMFSVRVPDGLTPDYTSASCPELRWTQLSLHIEKKVGPDGTQDTLGIKVCQTEECEDALNQLLNRCPIAVLSTTEMQKSFPLKVDHKGMLVVDVLDGENVAGKFSGLEPGDIITEVNISIGPEGKSSPKYILDELTRDERMALLRDASKLSVTVHRPSKSLLTLSQQWLWRVQKANAVYADTLKLQPGEVWYCSSCQVVTEPRGTENRIFAEARWCKSLIRRLGVESYSLPFHDELQSAQRRIPINVSLRRLDAMMEFISLTHDESLTQESKKEILNCMGNPFILPPWVVTSSPRMSWSPEEMEQKPMELLCKGIDMMMSPTDPEREPLNDERIALLRRFLLLFSARFLCAGKESSTLRPSGLVSHAFIARPPWIQASCIVCQSRPTITADSKCDRKGCQQPLSPEKENQGQSENGDRASFSPQNSAGDPTVAGSAATQAEPASFMHPKTGSDARVCDYDDRSSLVGTPLLALPGDPMLLHLSRELNQSIDHMDRPMVFVVASYLPYPYMQAEVLSSDQTGNGEGMFHILPVLTADQLKFLLTKCEMRRPAETYATNNSWTELQAFRLDGVIRMSAAELRMKLKETAAIREAIDAAVGAIASFSTIADPSLDCHAEVFVAGATTETVFPMLSEAVHGRAPELVDEYSTLIDGLMRCHSPFVRHMIDALCPNDANETDAIDLCLAGSENDLIDVDGTACDDQTDLGGGESAEQNTDSANGSLLSRRGDQHQQIDAVAAMETLLGSVTVSEVPTAQNANRMNQNFKPRPLAQPPHFAPPPPPIVPNPLPIVPNPLARQQRRMRALAPNRDTNAHHLYISRSDLYRAGLPGTVLTRIETAFLVEAHTRSLPLLGRRLLCPRYNSDVAGYQQGLVFRGDCSRIPRVQTELWDRTIQVDYDRSLRETGEPLWQEGNFSYCVPDAVLPLDRLTESFLDQQSLAGRIRGGGPSAEGADDIENDAVSQAHILANIPKEEWQNSLVHSRCQTTQQGNDAGEATIIGVVQYLLSTERPGEEAGDDEVPVAVFYLSSVGYMDDPLTMPIAADQLHIVQNGSDEARIADQCELVPRLMAPYTRTVSDDRMDTVPQDADAPLLGPTDTTIFDRGSSRTQDASPQEQTDQTSEEGSSMLKAASHLAQRLCHRREGPTPIGDLPDGRALLWLHSDPRALYIRIPTNDKFAIASCRVLQTLSANRATPDKEIGTGSNGRDCECYSCPWGCDRKESAASATATQKNALYFTLPSQLRDHLRTEHDFGLPANSIEIEGGGHMFRIAEGDSISTLSLQLKTTIRAGCLFLAEVVDNPYLGTMPIEEKTALNLEETMALIPEGRGGPRYLRHLLLLWSRIIRLFAAETTGLFRLEPGEWEAQATFEDQESSTDIAESSQLAVNGCLVEKLNAWPSGGTDSIDCELCHSRLESATEVKIERASADRDAPPARGTPSCALLCQLFGPDHTTESVSAQHGNGRAGVARSLLIRIASSIPTSLRQVDANGGHASSATTGRYVWEEGNYQNWRYLVERARDPKTFLQAFIVLVRSINTTKLPRWWKGAREGWSSSLVTMDVSSFSGLFLRLYVFDAAISEYVASTGTAATRHGEEHYMPEELKGLTTKEIMVKVQTWAKEMNYARFDGENVEECLLCGDGGDLICCEFCSNVQHAACCQPPIEDEAALDIWACLPCMNDIAVLYSATKEATT